MSILSEQDIRRIEDRSSEYREICVLAVVGAICGAASILALAHPAFWVLPLMAFYLNWRALGKIRDQPESLQGRAMALAGMAFSLVFGLSAPMITFGQEIANRHQAIEVARGWFEALRDNRPDIAHQWTVPRWMRVKEGDYVPSHYANASGKKAMKRFLERPTIRLLLNLGKQAQVRYYGNVASISEEEKRTIADVYAVTVGQGSDKMSFFLKLTVTARLDTTFKQWSWELTEYEFLSQMPTS